MSDPRPRIPRLPTRRQTHGIPSTVPIPKFLKPADLRKISERKAASPDRTWQELVREAVVAGIDTALSL